MPLSYMVSQSSAGAIANSRSALGSSTAQRHSSNSFKTKESQKCKDAVSGVETAKTTVHSLLSSSTVPVVDATAHQANILQGDHKITEAKAMAEVKQIKDLLQKVVGKSTSDTLMNMYSNNFKSSQSSIRALQQLLPKGSLTELVKGKYSIDLQ